MVAVPEILMPLLAAACCLVPALVARPRWASRDIPSPVWVVWVAWAVSSAIGVIVGLSVSGPAGVAAAGAAFYASVAVVTDAWAFLIPRELTWASLAVGIAGGGWALATDPALEWLPVVPSILAVGAASFVGWFLYGRWGLIVGGACSGWLLLSVAAGWWPAALLIALAGVYAVSAAAGWCGFSDVRMLCVASFTLWWGSAAGLLIGIFVLMAGAILWSIADRRLKGKFPMAPPLWAGMLLGYSLAPSLGF